MKSLQNIHYKIFYATIIFIAYCLTFTDANSEQCCKKFECFECDSRYDKRCGESFNLTRENAVTLLCNEYCVKLKHFINNEYHYVRTCSSTLKDVYIKKTHVCYTTMTHDDGYLCFCDDDLCNHSPSVYSSLFNSRHKYQYLSVLLMLPFYIFLNKLLIEKCNYL